MVARFFVARFLSVAAVLSFSTVLYGLSLAPVAVGQEHTAPADSSAQVETQLAKYVAYQLMLANRNTIDLSKAALGHHPDEQLQRFAQALRDAHWQFNEKLATMFPGVAAQLAEPTSVNTSNREESSASSLVVGLAELRTLARKTARLRFDLSKRAIDEAGDVDLAAVYLDQQVSNHRQLLAELKALQDFGSPEFQDLTSQMTRTLERHLITAQQLAQRLAGQDKS